MKKSTLVILALSFALLAWHPYKPKLDKNEEGLNGPVKYLIEHIWDWGSTYIIQKEYNKQGKLISIEYYACNEHSDSLKIGDYVAKGKAGLDKSKLDLEKFRKYEYSPTSKLLKEQNFGRDSIVYFEETYKYDSNDSLIFKSSWYKRNKDELYLDSTKYIYTSQDRKTNYIEICKNDTIAKGYYTFDTLGRLINSEIYHIKPKTINYLEKNKYMYNQSGKLVGVR